MKALERTMAALRAGREAWQLYGTNDGDRIEDMYERRWALFTGTMFSDAWRTAGYRPSPKLYAGTRLLWKHIDAVVTFYAMTVYQGELSTDGNVLPNGSLGAIPIVPQTGDETNDQNIRRAFAELTSAWNWRQQMSLRPMYGAALGDVMTELIDDPETGMAYPAIIWPGYVKEIVLDHVGNVKRYAYEYKIREEKESGGSTTYLFRKEVDGETSKFYRDGKPYAYYGPDTAVIEHGYGFAPAIWDRHRILWGERGASAIDSTMEALYELNSLLSHGKHVQHKAFSAPIIVKGAITRPGQTEVQLRRPTIDNNRVVETTEWLQGDADTEIVQAQFELGQTLAMIEDIRKGILDENPEAGFYRELRSMSQVSAPGIERALGDAVGRVQLARAGYDMNTVKLFQMAIAMCGNRVNLSEAEGGWKRPLNRRQQAFTPFDLDSYKAGKLDFMISERKVVYETEEERIAIARMKENLQTVWAFTEVGVKEDDARALIADRDASRWQAMNGGINGSLFGSGLISNEPNDGN